MKERDREGGGNSESERRKGEREKDERQVGDYGKKIIREGIEIPTRR